MINKKWLCIIILLQFLVMNPVIFAQTARVGIYIAPPHLDSTEGKYPIISEIIHGNILEGLTIINPDNTIVPLLAKSWKIENNGFKWIFYLKENVLFHDLKPLNAESVIFSMYRYIEHTKKKNTPNYLSAVDRIYADGENTVVFEGRKPLTFLPVILSLPELAIVSPYSAAFLKSDPVGTGPFVFSVREKELIRLEQNPKYHSKLPQSKILEYHIFPPGELKNAMTADKIDGIQYFPFPDIAKSMAEKDKFQIDTGISPGKVMLGMNPKFRPFNKIQIRKAVAHAINKQELIDELFYGMSENYGYAPTIDSESYLEFPEPHEFDIEFAKKLLKAGGYAKGFSMVLIIPPSALAEKTAQILAHQLKAVNIKTIIKKIPQEKWQTMVFKKKNYAITIIPLNEWSGFNIVNQSYTLFNHHSKGLENALNRLTLTGDPATVKLLTHSINRKTVLDAVNLFLFQIPKISVWKKGYSGYRINTLVPAAPLNTLIYSPVSQ